MIALEQKPEVEWTQKISPRLAAKWGVLPIYKRGDGWVAVLVRDENNFEALEAYRTAAALAPDIAMKHKATRRADKTN